MVCHSGPGKCERQLQDRTGTVSIAVVRTVAVLRTGVPAPALRDLLSGLAGLTLSCEHVALATTKLVWLLTQSKDQNSAPTETC